MHKYFFLTAHLLTSALLCVTATAGAAETPSAKESVYFVDLKDGATITPEHTVHFGVKGMKIGPAGKIVEGTGHHHLIIDGGPVKKGEVIPTDATHLHFGKGQTETALHLTPGAHTLTLQFADGAHKSYGADMSATVHVTVK